MSLSGVQENSLFISLGLSAKNSSVLSLGRGEGGGGGGGAGGDVPYSSLASCVSGLEVRTLL